MWFGVAPSPVPSPSRPSTQAWHPPHCTCTRHRNNAPRSPRGLLHGPLSPRGAQPTDVCASHSTTSARFAAKENQTQAAAVTAGPTSPRANRVHVMRSSFLACKSPRSVSKQPQQNEHEQLHAASSGPTLANWRVAQARTAAANANAAEPEAAMDTSQSLDDTLRSNNSDSETTSDSAAVRNSSAHHVSRDIERVSTAVRPLTTCADASSRSNLDPADTPPAPPKSRRASRICTAVASSEPQTQPKPSVNDHTATLSLPIPPAHLVGHTSSVCAVAAHDDRFIVTCSADGSVKVWSRVAPHPCLYTLSGHRDSVACAALHARWLVSGAHDATLRVYSVVDAFALCHVLRGHAAPVTTVQLPPTQSQPQLIVSGADDATVRIWHGACGDCLFVLHGPTSRITSVVVLAGEPTASRLHVWAGAADASICFWDLSANPMAIATDCVVPATRVFRVHTAPVQALVTLVAGNGSVLILSGSTDGTIQRFDAATATHSGCVARLHSPIYSLCAFGAGRLACATGDGRLLVYTNVVSRATVAKPTELQLATQWVSRLAVCHNSNALVCCSDDLLFVVDTADRVCLRAVLTSHHGFVTAVAWLDTQTLVSAGQDNVVRIWRFES